MEKVINCYECLFIANCQDAEVAKDAVEKFKTLVAENAETISVNEWGKRRLAYPILDLNDGYYTVITFKSTSDFPGELTRLLNIDERILRSMTLKLDFEPAAAAVVPEAIVAEDDTTEAAVEETAEVAAEEVAVEEPATETEAPASTDAE